MRKQTKECKLACLISPNYLIVEPGFKSGLSDFWTGLSHYVTLGLSICNEVYAEGSTLNRPV